MQEIVKLDEKVQAMDSTGRYMEMLATETHKVSVSFTTLQLQI